MADGASYWTEVLPDGRIQLRSRDEHSLQSVIVDAGRLERAVEHYRDMGEHEPEQRAIRWLLNTPYALL